MSGTEKLLKCVKNTDHAPNSSKHLKLLNYEITATVSESEFYDTLDDALIYIKMMETNSFFNWCNQLQHLMYWNKKTRIHIFDPNKNTCIETNVTGCLLITEILTEVMNVLKHVIPSFMNITVLLYQCQFPLVTLEKKQSQNTHELSL